MWKQRIKHTAAAIAGQLGVWALFDRAHRNTWTIVCYHRVLPEPDRSAYFCPDLVVTPEAFRSHCAVYKEHFDVLPVCEAFTRIHDGHKGTKPVLSISFDDGYRDNFIHAAPVLARFGLRASFYVIAGLADTDALPWYDAVALQASSPEAARLQVETLKRVPDEERVAHMAKVGHAAPRNPDVDRIMSAGQLRDLVAAGHEVGSHSATHPILPRVALHALAEELAGSKSRLEALVASPVSTFCYPNGDFDVRVLAGIRDAGYAAALSTRQGLNTKASAPHTLSRVFINESWLCTPGGAPSPALLRAELALTHRIRA